MTRKEGDPFARVLIMDLRYITCPGRLNEDMNNGYLDPLKLLF